MTRRATEVKEEASKRRRKNLSYAARFFLAFACVGCHETTALGMSLLEGKGRVVVGVGLSKALGRAAGNGAMQDKTNKEIPSALLVLKMWMHELSCEMRGARH